MSDFNIVALPAKKPEPESPVKFKVGQLVQLNAGGAAMTVESVTKNSIIAVWHDESANLCTGKFYPKMLREIEISIELDDQDAVDDGA